jgi:hypothetical protein
MGAWNKRKKEHPHISWGSVQQFRLERILSRVVRQMHDAGMDDTLNLVFDTPTPIQVRGSPCSALDRRPL